MTIDSEARLVPVSATLRGDHAHHDAGEHLHAHDAAAFTAGASPFLASALDRMAVAMVLAGVVWIGVVWAVN